MLYMEAKDLRRGDNIKVGNSYHRIRNRGSIRMRLTLSDVTNTNSTYLDAAGGTAPTVGFTNVNDLDPSRGEMYLVTDIALEDDFQLTVQHPSGSPQLGTAARPTTYIDIDMANVDDFMELPDPLLCINTKRPMFGYANVGTMRIYNPAVQVKGVKWRVEAFPAGDAPENFFELSYATVEGSA